MRRSLDLLADDRVRLPRDRALEELRADLVRTSFRPGPHELPNGVMSAGYFEKYRFVTRPAILRRLGRFLAELVPATTDRLAAPTLGATLIGAAVALETGLSLAVVRSGADRHREGVRPVEGGLHVGERVAVIEDVVVTGNRAASAVAQLRAAGAEVTTLVCVIDGLSGAQQRFEADLDYRPLLTVRDLGLAEDVFHPDWTRPQDPSSDAAGSDLEPDPEEDAQ